MNIFERKELTFLGAGIFAAVLPSSRQNLQIADLPLGGALLFTIYNPMNISNLKAGVFHQHKLDDTKMHHRAAKNNDIFIGM